MIRANANIGTIAEATRATCRSCVGDDCTNNILEDILNEKILTSGYFAVFSSKKLSGKCSHGGFVDRTSRTEPTGGINKDSFTSEHGHLHRQAADVAIAATNELLEDIRGAAGDKPFLQMMGLFRGKALCFAIDTTGSMSDDIEAVKTVTSSIIDRKVGTQDEPSVYILVPFNDPGFGPLMKTTDPDVFKTYINSLTAIGGGDFEELSLSGLQLALTGSPPNSEIFVFTDATAKDAFLRNAVIALIESTKSTVNFMITNILSRRRRQADDNQQQSRVTTRADVQLYRDLAQASGGQAIQVTKSQLLEATSIIRESISASLAVLLQAARNPGKTENFTFAVDESVTNLTIYITGTSIDFTLIDPSGSTLICVMRFTSREGEGQSPIDFLFDFIKDSDGPFGGFVVLDNRPTPGDNASLMITLFGDESAIVTEVTLVELSGSGRVNGSVEAQGGGEYIVRFDRIPSFQFVVFVKGQKNDSTSGASLGIFQRQSTTSQRASSLTVTVGDSNSTLEPGSVLSVPFSVMTTGEGGSFTIQATNDQGFPLTSPSSLELDAGGSANGTVNITAPAATPSGTSVTLTIEAAAPGGADTNYAVLRLTVLQPVTDFAQPVCQLLSLQSNCSDDCSQSWELLLWVTDGVNGTGVDRISLQEGNGTLNISTAVGNETMTLVSYNASCCSPDVRLVAVDQAGNVEFCSYSVRAAVTPTVTPTITPTVTTGIPTTAANTTSTSARAVQSVFLCLAITILGLIFAT
ncbi:von Willebrand factor A domain-containing protein 7-like [Kryptolebias marmoratus]|uniref:von Willebrand factor A domain-containing protein 7-like n=1 Tax=Kryptolebias marmoratus TaxID=37003 RepID=UPI0018ACAA18|nr:von Willebrand factor A domain-containing protein 7-like [Kryptolebias marmoratus]